MIEKACQDKNSRKFDRNFRIEVYMSETKNYSMEMKVNEKDGAKVEIPVEKFTDDQINLLEIAN